MDEKQLSNFLDTPIVEGDFEIVQDMTAFELDVMPDSERIMEDTTLNHLINAQRFAKIAGHAKGFFKKEGGYCIGGLLLAGNGENLDDCSNLAFPFNDEKFEKYNLAGHILNSLSPTGNFMELNDTKWFTKDMAVKFFGLAIEKAE